MHRTAHSNSSFVARRPRPGCRTNVQCPRLQFREIRDAVSAYCPREQRPVAPHRVRRAHSHTARGLVAGKKSLATRSQNEAVLPPRRSPRTTCCPSASEIGAPSNVRRFRLPCVNPRDHRLPRLLPPVQFAGIGRQNPAGFRANGKTGRLSTGFADSSSVMCRSRYGAGSKTVPTSRHITMVVSGMRRVRRRPDAVPVPVPRVSLEG